ncbi:VPLPA-CTERM sorting domain-containing protein [Roseibium aggregatum]|uniref:VPLPA-CTERM sorting domain-containing protein n=1 Tax=Roseibium aggregatum TaxID=187304 RepID=A0A939EJT4_9HYPH|nr:VPLPA-CTERM sorting domain-containing protein [Roseibium aggregatum]MBN9672985.1 VPLPA-CTERM sorting domain-containing protein [Roseibium aggregatum]
MKNLIIGALILIGLSLGGQSAQAAPLGLTTEDPTIEASFAVIDFFEFSPGEGDLSTFSAAIDFTSGTSLASPATIDFLGSFSLSDPAASPFGFLDIFDVPNDPFAFPEVLLSGVLIDVGFASDKIELLFGSLTGSVAGEFGSQVLMSVFFDDQLGENPFEALEDGESYTASISISKVASIGVVPLPAALPLLVTAFVGLGLIRRKP